MRPHFTGAAHLTWWGCNRIQWTELLEGARWGCLSVKSLQGKGALSCRHLRHPRVSFRPGY
jgi:hypothetical protein